MEKWAEDLNKRSSRQKKNGYKHVKKVISILSNQGIKSLKNIIFIYQVSTIF